LYSRISFGICLDFEAGLWREYSGTQPYGTSGHGTQ